MISDKPRVIRFGIIGAGQIARDWAQCMPLARDCRIVAVAARDKSKGDAFAKRFSIPRSYSRFKDLVADPEIDVVYIATHLHSHYEFVKLCLDSGKAVLCEKPFVSSAKQAKELFDLAKEKNLFLMEAMWTRFIPAMISARSMVHKGAIGDVQLIVGDFGIDQSQNPDHRLFKPELGGGSIIDLGVYPLSLAMFVCGPISSVKAAATIGQTKVDLTTVVAVSFANGAIGQFLSSITHNTARKLSIYGSSGEIHIQAPIYAPSEYIMRRKSLFKKIEQTGWRHLIDRIGLRLPQVISPYSRRYRFPFSGKGYQFEIDAVAQALRSGFDSQPQMNAQDTIHLMEVVDDIRSQIEMKVSE
jgi:predicted dehydrogenase